MVLLTVTGWLQYFWRVIDLRKDGLLHPATVDFFFRDIRQVLTHSATVCASYRWSNHLQLHNHNTVSDTL